MHRLFISYSAEDRELASDLRRELRHYDIQGFLDKNDLSTGADLSSSIRGAIKNADAVVVLLSKHALKSKWIMFEVGLAESLDKKIIPVLLPGASFEDSVPPSLYDRLILLTSEKSIPEASAEIIAALEGLPPKQARSLLSSRQRWVSMLLLVAISMITIIGILYL